MAMLALAKGCSHAVQRQPGIWKNLDLCSDLGLILGKLLLIILGFCIKGLMMIMSTLYHLQTHLLEI
jgi:hypothetical protein